MKTSFLSLALCGITVAFVLGYVNGHLGIRYEKSFAEVWYNTWTHILYKTYSKAFCWKSCFYSNLPNIRFLRWIWQDVTHNPSNRSALKKHWTTLWTTIMIEFIYVYMRHYIPCVTKTYLWKNASQLMCLGALFHCPCYIHYCLWNDFRTCKAYP